MVYYRDLSSYLMETFGDKLYKLSFDGGFTCPNRDGKIDTRGCIFCAGGSGDFAEPVRAAGETPDGYAAAMSLSVDRAKRHVSAKAACDRYIFYFQSFTGTYGNIDNLRLLYTAAVSHPQCAVLSIATRPDCLPDEALALLSELNKVKPVWIELGLQTTNENTADYIRRGYPLSVFDEAMQKLNALHIPVIVHQILGLPGETKEDMVETSRYIGQSGAFGIKLQLLHILAGTDLAEAFKNGLFQTLSLEEYIDILVSCVKALPENMVIHRLTGDGDKRLLLAPLWSADKKRVLGAIQKRLLPRKNSLRV